MEGLTATEYLGASLMDGSFADADVAEFADLAVAAADENPDDWDAVYENAMAAKFQRDFYADLEQAVTEHEMREQAYHAPAAEGIVAAAGITPDDYKKALADYKAGDPSLLTALRSRFMEMM